MNGVKQLRDNYKKRNFKQSVDLAVSLKGIDLKKPENKFKESIVLPKGRGNPSKVAVIGEELVSKSNDLADELITGDVLSNFENDKRAAKKMVDGVDFFVAEPAFMARVGKSLGRILGPRNKMPQPFPPQGDPTPLIERLKKTVRVSLKDDPVIHCLVGDEDMKDEDLAENIDHALSVITSKLSNNQHNIKSVYIKMTMGPVVKVK